MICNSIPDNELLSRFIVYKRWAPKGRIKQNAFMPDKDLTLSVTRHLNLSQEDIWRYGRLAEGAPPRDLHGRADVNVGPVKYQGLHIEMAPTNDNPNHAHVVNWPPNKDLQKIKAILLAKEAQFVPVP